MRIDDFSDVQDLMKTRAALQSSLAELDDKLRALGVVVPKPVTEFDLAILRLNEHLAQGFRVDADLTKFIVGGSDHRVEIFDTEAVLGIDWGIALRVGEQTGTAQITIRGGGKQRAILPLGRHMVLQWAAMLSDIAAKVR
tara:strand:+ start:268 stop:687 length:420 start_codon:yes stop_codon:yes gene_type:complete